MNIRKKLDPVKCCANRCTKMPVERHDYPNGDSLWYCMKHAPVAYQEATEAEISPTVVPIADFSGGTVTPLSAAGPDSAAETLPDPEILTAVQVAAKEALEKDREKANGAIAKIYAPDCAVALQQDKEAAEADLADLEDFSITNPAEEVPFAESERDRIRALRKAYEKQRTVPTKPLNAILRGVNAWFKPTQDVLGRLEAAWTRILNQHRAQAQAEQLRLLEAAQSATEPEKQREALVRAAEVAEEPAGTIFIDRWKFEVVDASQLPREFLCPDEKKIGKVVKILKQNAEIPGIRVWNAPIQRRR